VETRLSFTRVERTFDTTQDRLVKRLRLAHATTLKQANQYLETKFLPWWNQTLKVITASPADAHPHGSRSRFSSSLSYVESRKVDDYMIRYQGKLYQVGQSGIRPGLRGGAVRVELRLDGSLVVGLGDVWIGSASASCGRRRCRLYHPSRDLLRPT
jgi:hypothetical protein